MSGALLRPWALWQLKTLPSQSHSLFDSLSWWSWGADMHFPGCYWPKSLKISFDFLQETPPINTTMIQLLYKQINKKFKWIITTLILRHLIYITTKAQSICKCIFNISEKLYAIPHVLLWGWCYILNVSHLVGPWAPTELFAPCMPISHKTVISCWPVK